VTELPPVGVRVTFRRTPTARLNSSGLVVGQIEGFALVEHRRTDRFGGSRVHTDRIPAHRILSIEGAPPA
jgi:hypothetical protein